MMNIIFTGLISLESRFRKSIKDFEILKKNKTVNQIILSTWVGELDKYEGLRKYLIDKGIEIIESIPPTNCNGSILYQMKALHIGLEGIRNKKLMIFKTRPDVYLSNKYLLDVFNLNTQIEEDIISIFEKKVWVPWFEITKPFYFADECIYATYNDMRKLINYDMIYDSYYRMDSGISHIRRFIHPFIEKYPILQKYLKYLSTTGHGTINRFEVLSKFTQNKDYWKFIYLYYYIVENYFHIGINNTEAIEFRKWSKASITLPKDLKRAYQKKYSWDEKLGHIYCENNDWLKGIDGLIIKDIETLNEEKLNFNLNEIGLADLHKFALTQKEESTQKNSKHNVKRRISKYIRYVLRKN